MPSPAEVSARRRVILATPDLRAQAHYHKAGLAQRCAIYTFYKQPEARAANHPIDQDFRMSAFVCFLMSDVPFGRMKNYIFTAPLYHI